MSLLLIFLVFVVVGFLAWLITNYVPMPPPIKTLLVVVTVIFLLVWVLQGTGVLGGLPDIHVGRRR